MVTADLLFDIRATNSGTPTEADSGSNLLASVSLPAASVSTAPGWVSVDLSPQNLSVAAGQRLAIALRSDDPGGVAGVTYSWADGGE